MAPGFVDNKEEEEYLDSEKGVLETAQSILNGIKKYKAEFGSNPDSLAALEPLETMAGYWRQVGATFAGGERPPEDDWDFHYYVVRYRGGKAVLATFFTAALWKDDMLASAQVSELV